MGIWIMQTDQQQTAASPHKLPAMQNHPQSANPTARDLAALRQMLGGSARTDVRGEPAGRC